MQNKKLIRIVESFVIVPMVAMSGTTLGPIPQANPSIVTTPSVVQAQKFNIQASVALALNQANITQAAPDPKAIEEQAEADAIDAYFKSHGMPLEGTGMKMVKEAENNDLDWRLVPAIAVRESTGGKNDCIRVDNNPFGWGSCKIGFKSLDEAIETIAKNLGGNNPSTARHYDNKTTKQILRAYNPPSVVPRYAEQVISIMDTIGPADISTGTSTTPLNS